jgi:hypothetical protein
VPDRIIALSLLAAISCWSAAAGAQGPPRIPESEYANAGRALALRLCTPCHVVAPDQETRPTRRPPATSFEEIARRPGLTAESLRGFLLTTHSASAAGTPAMPNPMLDQDQLTYVVHYLLALRGNAADGRR